MLDSIDCSPLTISPPPPLWKLCWALTFCKLSFRSLFYSYNFEYLFLCSFISSSSLFSLSRISWEHWYSMTLFVAIFSLLEAIDSDMGLSMSLCKPGSSYTKDDSISSAWMIELLLPSSHSFGSKSAIFFLLFWIWKWARLSWLFNHFLAKKPLPYFCIIFVASSSFSNSECDIVPFIYFSAKLTFLDFFLSDC